MYDTAAVVVRVWTTMFQDCGTSRFSQARPEVSAGEAFESW